MGSGETSSHVVSSPRRLAAILAADIAGFSRLMGLDEEGTLARVKRIRREIIEPTLAEHQGRLIKTSGDGFLAMFESPLEAVRCAIVIQQTMLARNTSLSKQQWIQFRIGVNLGDVIVEPDDIFGDGVNIAARLESLAAPGEVYISGGVYEQVKNKLVCGYHSLGDEKLKNITDPVQIYRVLPDPGAVARAQSVNWRTVLVSGVVLALAAAALLAIGFLNVFRAREPQTAGVTYQDPPGFAPASPSSSQPAQAQSGALPRATQPAEPTARSLEARNQQGPRTRRTARRFRGCRHRRRRRLRLNCRALRLERRRPGAETRRRLKDPRSPWRPPRPAWTVRARRDLRARSRTALGVLSWRRFPAARS